MIGDHFIQHSILLVSFFTGVPGDQDSNLEVIFIIMVVGEESDDVVKYMQHTLTH